MQVAEYQRWLKAYDAARGWDKVAPSQTFVHLVEELGEVAHLLLYVEGYRDAADKADLRAELTEELGDVAAFLFKLAYQLDIEMEDALAGNQTKNEPHDVEAGQQEMERYLGSQEQNLRRMKGISE